MGIVGLIWPERIDTLYPDMPAPNPSGYAFGFDPTSRCHKRKFLLKFAKDKQRWMYWLFEAKKRFGPCILNFIVTSNHNQMAYKAIGRRVVENGDSCVLREPHVSYQSISDRKVRLQPEDNTIYWPNRPENYPATHMSLERSI